MDSNPFVFHRMAYPFVEHPVVPLAEQTVVGLLAGQIVVVGPLAEQIVVVGPLAEQIVVVVGLLAEQIVVVGPLAEQIVVVGPLVEQIVVVGPFVVPQVLPCSLLWAALVALAAPVQALAGPVVPGRVCWGLVPLK